MTVTSLNAARKAKDAPEGRIVTIEITSTISAQGPLLAMTDTGRAIISQGKGKTLSGKLIPSQRAQ